MQMSLLQVLACPKCSGTLSCAPGRTNSVGEVLEGILICSSGLHEFRIDNGIPRFISQENYAQSFGYQWNRFKLEQIDSCNGTELSAERFYSETGWTPEWLKGKWILDAGCGAGRFLDVVANNQCEVVGLDISDAIDAAKANLEGRTNVHFVQASIYELPFRRAAFDGCYCIGVVQHTPDPQKATEALPPMLSQGGRIAVSAYERKLWTRLYSKYLLRPITKRVDKKRLLACITRMMPFLFPITNLLFRLPVAGRLFMFAIPIANYVDEATLTPQQRYQWAILDTFDMLSPQYDSPRTQGEIECALGAAGIVEIERIPGRGLYMVGRKAN